MSEEGMKRLLGIDDETVTEMREGWAALNIEWHCPGRHGVVRDVPSAEAGRVQRIIEWHVGSGACRWTKAAGGKRSVEFVHMTKVFPPPKKPWEWCGETVLFQEWFGEEMRSAEALSTFHLGEKVMFVAKGTVKAGEVTKINRKTVAVHVSGEGQWTVPPTELHKVKN